MEWQLILKKNITDDEWKSLAKRILQDELPKDRKKYVKYSVLDEITKRMVNYYLDKGMRNQHQRQRCMKGILEDMARSSNVRFDVEDKSKNARDE